MLVLKIIGIVLLSILAFIFLLLALVLFVPIRYQATIYADGTDLEKLRAEAKVHWLLYLVSVGAVFREKQFKLVGRIAFVKLFGEKKDKKSKVSGKKKTKERAKKAPREELWDDEIPEDFPEEEIESGAKVSEVKESTGEKEPEASRENISTGDHEKRETQEKREKQKKEKKPKKNKKEKKPKEKDKKQKKKKEANPNSLPNRLKRLYENREKVLRVYEKEKPNLQKALRRTGRILKKILPRKCLGYVEFGMSDPATTGKVLGYISALYALTGPVVNLYPNFTESCIKADVKIKGHFSIIEILIYVLQVPFNRELRRAYRYLRKLSEAQENKNLNKKVE